MLSLGLFDILAPSSLMSLKKNAIKSSNAGSSQHLFFPHCKTVSNTFESKVAFRIHMHDISLICYDGFC